MVLNGNFIVGVGYFMDRSYVVGLLLGLFWSYDEFCV